ATHAAWPADLVPGTQGQNGWLLQCRRMPAAAPRPTRYGSLTFHFSDKASAATARSTVFQSGMAWRASTVTAPAMAPAAAAVAPRTKALTCLLLRWRTNQRPGMTTPREIGVKIATVATTAPASPPTT